MPLAMKNFKTILGRGIEAEDENASYYAGNEAFMKEKGVSLDDLGDTLDAEAYLGVAGGEPPAVRGKDAGTQLVLVHLAQLRNVRCSLSQFRRRPGRGHCLGKYGLDHGVFLLDVDALAFWAQA